MLPNLYPCVYGVKSRTVPSEMVKMYRSNKLLKHDTTRHIQSLLHLLLPQLPTRQRHHALKSQHDTKIALF